jgi:Ca2+-binding RTX toxin-like protein
VTDYVGKKGNDHFTGTVNDDTFDLSQGGEDTASGGGGNDTFTMGKAFDAHDRIDGGTGFNQLYLDGNYNLTFLATTMTNIQQVYLVSGHHYSLTTNDATVAAGAELGVDGSNLGASDALVFNGAAETNGTFVVRGGAGNDTLTGGNGDDTLSGGDGTNTLNGGAGSDSLYGGAGTSTMSGGDGDDYIYGDVGNDKEYGGTGNDYLTGATGHNTLSGGAGDDTLSSTPGFVQIGSTITIVDKIDGGSGDDTAVIDRSSATANLTFHETSLTSVTTLIGDGTTVVNVETFELTGGSGDDKFTTGAGDDALAGGAGNNTLNGGAGNDTLGEQGQTGNNTLIGGLGDDALYGSTGHNVLSGGDGNDTINSYGTDKIDGGIGTDTVTIDRSGATTNLTFNETNPASTATLVGDGTTVVNVENIGLLGGSGNDSFTTGAGNDSLSGGAGHNTLNGGAGDDVITSTGIDAINGGTGDDLVNIDRSTATANLTFHETSPTTVTTLVGDGTTVVNIKSFIMEGGSGNDNFTTGAGNDALYGNGGNNTLNGGAGDDELYEANQTGTNTLIGGAGNDYVLGGDGHNTLNGGDGNDTLTGYGTDTIAGGTGNDLIYSYGVATIDGGDGIDTVSIDRSSVTTKLTFNETSLTSYTTLVGDGTKVANVENIILYGGTGNDSFTTGAGADQLYGGAGSNTLNGGAGNDYLYEYTETGKNTLTGGSGNDILIGGSGHNTMNGGTGNDAIYSYGVDTIDGGADTDTALIARTGATAGLTFHETSTSATTTMSDGTTIINVENIDLFGGSGNDSFITGDGNDTLDGGGGADQMIGGKGNDNFQYGAVSDSTGPAYDTIGGFDASADYFTFAVPVTAVDAAVTAGALNTTAFNANLAAVLTASKLGAGHAVLFTPSSGTLAGHTFLVVDANGIAGYQGGQDFVIQLHNAAHLSSLSLADFHFG